MKPAQPAGVNARQHVNFPLSGTANQLLQPVQMRGADRQRIGLEPRPDDHEPDVVRANLRHAIQIERCPVLIALEVVPAFDNVGADGIVDDPTGPSRGLHAQCLYGFDNVGALDANSWGTSWGRHGGATLTPRFLAGAVVWAGALSLEAK